MAITSFGRGRDADSGNSASSKASAPASSSSSANSSSPGGLTAFIDQGSEFEGKLSFRDTVRIDGRFQGEITSENTLIVGESGEIEAEIRSKTVAISGTVRGDVIASEKVVLHKSAKVTGNVQAPSLVVEEGAHIDGQIIMTGVSGKSVSALKATSSGSDSKGESSAS
jgi:cytoskeletal protein CcmA (bactofilin family)